MAERKAEGAITSMVLKPQSQQFYFTFKLEGTGCPIDSKKMAKKSSKVTNGMTKAPSSSTGGKDPISASVNDRKAAGSILALVNQGPPDELTVFKFKLNGAGAKVSMITKTTPTRGSQRF